LARTILDFGSANGSLTPPAFTWYRDSSTHAALPAPTVSQTGGAGWTYQFDSLWPIPTSLSTKQVDYGLTLNGTSLSGVLLQPGLQQTRFFLDFGATNGQRTPPTFTWYRDETTKAAITPPAVSASAVPGWTYFFDAVFPAGTTAIEYGLTLNGVSLSGVLAAPSATQGIGGAMTLAALIALIRQEADIENDPHISDAEITGYLNQSRLRLYGKMATSFGDDYFSVQNQFTTDGVSSQFPLPNGVNYGGAPAFFKEQLLEVVAGGNISPNAPITLLPFMLREKNRYTRPYSMLAVPGMFPRWRIMDGNVVFTPTAPAAGLVCNLWYVPQLAPLVNSYDVAADWNGWLELPVVDVTIKCLSKQERDASTQIARKNTLVEELDKEIANRVIGEPNTVVETETESMGPLGLPGMGAWGGGFY